MSSIASESFEDEFYEGYDCDVEQYSGENYYSGDEYEMNGAYSSYDEHERVEVSYDESNSENEGNGGSHITRHGDEDDVRYDALSHMSYESFEDDCDGRGSCDDELPSLSCTTSYPSREGIDVWVEPIRGRRVDHRKRTFSTCWDARTCTSYPHSYVTSYGEGVGGRMEGSMNHRSRENSLFQDVYDRERRVLGTKVTSEPLPIGEFAHLTRMHELGASMQRTLERLTQLVTEMAPDELERLLKGTTHRNDEPKEFPLEAKQATPCEVGVKELNMQVNASTPCAPKWKRELKASPNPSQGILGTYPDSNKVERQKIERRKGVICDNSRVEKGEFVCSDVRGLSQPYTSFCNFSSFSSCLDSCVGILGDKPSEASRAMKNHEMLKSFPNEQMCMNVENQGECNPSYELQGNKAKPYTFLKEEDPCVASSQLSVSDGLYMFEIKDHLPCDDLDDALLHDDNAIVVSAQTLVDLIDDRIDSSSKIDLSSPCVSTYDLSENVLSCNTGSQMLVGYNVGNLVFDSFELDMLPTSVNCGDDQFVCKDDLLIEELRDVINEAQFSDGNDRVGHVDGHVGSLIRGDDSLGVDYISYSYHEVLEVEYDLRDNLLFNEDMANVNDEHSGVSYNVGSVATLEGYQLFENPLWCDDTPSKYGNLFLVDDSTFNGRDSVQREGDICATITPSSLCVSFLGQGINVLEPKSAPFHENSLDEVVLYDTFLYYLFAYDDPLIKCGLMLVTPKENMSFPILGVSYVLPSHLDKLVLKLCGPQLGDAKWFVYLWGIPWVLKAPCHLHRIGQVEFSNWTLRSMLSTFLYYLFAYDDTHVDMSFIYYRGIGIWVLHFFVPNGPLWVIAPFLVRSYCEVMKQLCLMAPKSYLISSLGIFDAIKTFVVSLSHDVAYNQFLCILYDEWIFFNTKDSWLYFKCVPPWQVGMIDNPCANPRAMRICLLFVLLMFCKVWIRGRIIFKKGRMITAWIVKQQASRPTNDIHEIGSYEGV